MAAVPQIGRAAGVEPRPAPEAAAAEDLYERYARRVFGFCLHRLGSREEAEDAVQQTFLNAFRGLRRGIVPEAEAAWLFKIAENVCLTRRRSSARRGRVEAPGDMNALQDFVAAPPRLGTEELIELQGALAGMPAGQRKAILLREWQGLSYREIARELGLTQAAVETLIFRARRSLAAGLEQAPERRRGRRLRAGGDLGAAAAALKSALAAAGAAKVVATGAAVTVAAGALALAPAERRHELGAAAPAAAVPAGDAAPAAASPPRPASASPRAVGAAAAPSPPPPSASARAPREGPVVRPAAPPVEIEDPGAPAAGAPPPVAAESGPAAMPEPAPAAAPPEPPRPAGRPPLPARPPPAPQPRSSPRPSPRPSPAAPAAGAAAGAPAAARRPGRDSPAGEQADRPSPAAAARPEAPQVPAAAAAGRDPGPVADGEREPPGAAGRTPRP